jgi:hypothetical protein
MNYYCSLDQFQGIWLGSIIGAALANNIDSSDYRKIFQYKYQNWIITREQIAKIIIENQQVESISEQLNKIVFKDYLICFKSDLQSSLSNSNTVERIPETQLVISHCHMLSLWLPLMIFAEDNPNIYQKIIPQHDINAVNTTEIENDIIIWNYLLSLVLKNKLRFKEPNVSMIVKHILGGAEVQTTSLVKKLKIISQAWENGLSLRELTEKLYQQENIEKKATPTVSLAIALSFYCFISTPNNFMLSVQRANSISSLAEPISILTATISGAYNGLASIPRNWKQAASHHQNYQQAETTAAELFRTWLGVERQGNSRSLFDPEVNAVAIPKIIQPRQNLKIISQ